MYYWIKHIKDPRPDKDSVALCGASLFDVFCFENIDHWFCNASVDSRIVGCKKCIHEIISTAKKERS